MIVLPFNLLISSNTAFSETGSNDDVGSSKIKIGFSEKNTLAKTNFCHCPPDNSNPSLSNGTEYHKGHEKTKH